MFIIGINSYNSIILILTDNKLIKPKYFDWKRILNIVFNIEMLKWAIQEVALPIFNELSTKKKKDAYSYCIILGYLSYVLQQQHMDIATTYEILLSLQEVFGDKGKSARQVALRTVTNTKITKRTPLRDYMIHMIILFNKIKIFGAKIDGET